MYKIIGAPKKYKKWPCPIFRPETNNTCTQKPNVSRETVSLIDVIDQTLEAKLSTAEENRTAQLKEVKEKLGEHMEKIEKAQKELEMQIEVGIFYFVYSIFISSSTRVFLNYFDMERLMPYLKLDLELPRFFLQISVKGTVAIRKITISADLFSSCFFQYIFSAKIM
jgi:hypothetical protein